MYNFIAITLLLLIAVAAVLLYYQNKSKRLQAFKKGICPNCGAEPTKIYDKEKQIFLTKNPIDARVLRNNGCSGAIEMEYRCKECDIKEVFNERGGSCGV